MRGRTLRTDSEISLRRLDAIERALDFIEENLLESPSVAEIAAAGGLSRTHLQRLFAELVGESAGAYCRRRRLCRSMNTLLSTDRRVLEIALEMGFQSQEAYTRAFRAHFGIAPATFRKHGERFSDLVEPRLTRSRLEMRADPTKRGPRFESRGGEIFVGVRGPFIWAMSDGSNVHDVVPDAWARFESGWNGHGRERRYGLTFPANVDKRQRGDELDFMASACVDEVPATLPQGFTVKRTRPSDFAVFSHRGPSETFRETVMYAFLDWLPDAPFEYAAEGVQLRSFAAATGGSDEFWLPIEPLGEPPPWRLRQCAG